MGRIILDKPLEKITKKHIHDEDLVIKMLKHEEILAKGDFGKKLYTNELNNPLTSLTCEKTLNRKTLSDFGFKNDDESVEMYRSIFRTYYKSPTNYNKNVIDSSYYMRGNRCVFFTSKKLRLGDELPDCELFTIENKSLSLHDIIDEDKITVVAGFSLS
jgi:hypothetical protein